MHHTDKKITDDTLNIMLDFLYKSMQHSLFDIHNIYCVKQFDVPTKNRYTSVNKLCTVAC